MNVDSQFSHFDTLISSFFSLSRRWIMLRLERRREPSTLSAFLQQKWGAFCNWQNRKEVSLALTRKLQMCFYNIFWLKSLLPASRILVAKLLTTVCATGGGAFKFEQDFLRVSSSCIIGKFIELIKIFTSTLFHSASIYRKWTQNWRNSMSSTLWLKAFYIPKLRIPQNVIFTKMQVILGERLRKSNI